MSTRNKTRVIVGMSGGVDSSVAAALLLEQGYAVEGLFMKNWEEDDTEEYCAAADDLRDAQAVCDQLGIRLHSVNFASEYWDRVFSYFLAEYRAGRTPNPDVLCNKEIKFRAFLDHALGLGADRIATGHYARLHHDQRGWHLLAARDANKDQTYFLYTLNQYQLGHSLFPLGELEKSEVRRIARRHAFPNHDKKDSTGICFIGERKFRDFLARYLPATPGDIRTPEGERIGRHDGLMYYTLGQRKGLGIGGLQAHGEQPWFVADKDLAGNTLIVVQGTDHPLLYKQTLQAIDLHWVAGTAPELPLACQAKIRYRQTTRDCTLHARRDGGCRVVFTQAQRAITPGQSVVFYRHDECLGGGIIASAATLKEEQSRQYHAR
jgi:tRNA-specific 2-thiouridylase